MSVNPINNIPPSETIDNKNKSAITRILPPGSNLNRLMIDKIIVMINKAKAKVIIGFGFTLKKGTANDIAKIVSTIAVIII